MENCSSRKCILKGCNNEVFGFNDDGSPKRYCGPRHGLESIVKHTLEDLILTGSRRASPLSVSQATDCIEMAEKGLSDKEIHRRTGIPMCEIKYLLNAKTTIIRHKRLKNRKNIEDSIGKDLAERILAARKRGGNISEVAEAYGISRHMVYKLEKDQEEPRNNCVDKIYLDGKLYKRVG